MRTRIVFFVAGLVLALVIVGGALALRAQGGNDAPKWEYAFITFETNLGNNVVDLPITHLELNGQSIAYGETGYQLFDALGADGWEYIEKNGSFFIFKRALTQ